MTTPTCYMCEAAALSREHAPPLCFFPEKKDLEPGQDFRKSLITVPSCIAHNLTTSKDDEYVLVIVVTHFETNHLARHHFGTKIVRALKRSPAFTAGTLNRNTPVVLNGKPTVAIQVDDERFERVMIKTVRAIYFHHFHQKLVRAVRVQSTAFRQFDAEAAEQYRRLAALGDQLFAGAERFGTNPEVFYYQVRAHSANGNSVLRMVFFEGFDVYGIWGPAVDLDGAV